MTQLPTVAGLLAWTSNRHPDRSATPARAARLIERCVPHKDGRETIKVAGTNGKGSVCGMLEAYLLSGGGSVGVFTSPHFQRITERIRVNGVEIASSVLEHHARTIQPSLLAFADEHGPRFIPSFFEVLLLIALRVFHDEDVACAVLEAGIGGAHDATGVIPASVSAVTSIAFDHEAKVGGTLTEIAREKAGIATPNATLVLGPAIRDELVQVVRRRTAKKNVRVTQARRRSVDADNSKWPSYQHDNLATTQAILAARAHPSGDDPLRSVSAIALPGRFEYVEGSPDWLLDGAHNAEAIAALICGIEQRFATRERTLIFGVSEEKSYARYVPRLSEIADEVHVVDCFANAARKEDVVASMPDHVAPKPWQRPLGDLVRFVRRTRGDALVVVTGSIFLVGAIRTLLLPPGRS